MRQPLFAVLLMLCACAAFSQQTPDEVAVWKLEHAYWENVKALDLVSYRALWHPNFVGWPSVSAEPQRKDHITDWIALYTDKGLHLGYYSLKPAASQATGDDPHTSRITHTWVRVGTGWQIIGGMSSAEPDVKK